jgi:hypothetical protein
MCVSLSVGSLVCCLFHIQKNENNFDELWYLKCVVKPSVKFDFDEGEIGDHQFSQELYL